MVNSSLRSFLYNALFILVVVALYFLNNNREDAVNEQILNIILSGFTLLIIICITIALSFNILLIDKIDFFPIIGLIISFILTFYFRRYLSIHFIYLMGGYFVIKNKSYLNPVVVKVVVALTCLSLAFQLSYFRFIGRPVLSYHDPNYSGFFIFIFFLFCYKKSYKPLALIIMLVGFVTLSRNYLLAVAVFFLFSSGFVKTVIRKIRLLNFYTIFFIGISLPLIIGAYFLKNIAGNYQNENNGYYDNSSSRLLEFKDRSNEDRFIANALFLADLSTNPKLYIWGRDLKEYTSNVFMNSPHNSFFQLLLNYGMIFTFFYILLFGRMINRSLDKENIPYIFSMLVYFVFLGGGIYGIQVIFIFFILNEKRTALNYANA